MTRMEAEFVQREAPPSYGQLIAQGLIPPVEDFPVYNPTQVAHSHTLLASNFPEAKLSMSATMTENISICVSANLPRALRQKLL